MILFRNKTDLETQLLADILYIISECITEHGDARILLSGGSSPVGLYETLAKSDLNWKKIHIGLVDDRNVPVTNEYSNEKMIREIFKDHSLPEANIYSLLSTDNNLSEVEAKYAPFFERTDLSILGMGTDGHTASLFPNDQASEELLNSEKASINYTIAPQHPTNRITCSKGLLKQSEKLILMLFGEEKKTVFLESQKKLKPISYFVRECPQLKTYYSS